MKASDVRQVQEVLRPLKFDIDKDEKHTRPLAVQKYLDHYRINFARTMKRVRHGFGTFEAEGFTVAAHYWLPFAEEAGGQIEPPKGTVFVFHGYFDHVGLFRHLIRFSLQHGYAVVAYDLPGMGLSSGERATIHSFDCYYRVMRRCCEYFRGVVPQPWAAVGQSTGSSALLRHVLTEGSAPFSKVVLLAPLVRSKGWQRDRWLYGVGRFFIRSLPRVFSENSHDQAFLDFVEKADPLQARHLPIRWVGAMKDWIDDFARFPSRPDPVLVIQGDSDDTVDWQYNLEQIKSKLPNATIKIIPRGRHHLAAESAPYRAQVFAAVKSWLENPDELTGCRSERPL